MPEAVFLTQQTVGLGARKTSMVFLAEAFAARNWDVGVVTVQLSQITRFRRDSRLADLPAGRINRWCPAGDLDGFIWVPLAHPFRLPSKLLNRLTAPLLPLYAYQLPRALKRRLATADLIVIESCAAVALYPRLRRLAPNARFVYSMSDRLDVVGMHPALQRLLLRVGPTFDLVRVPAEALLGDIPRARTAYIPHGLEDRS